MQTRILGAKHRLTLISRFYLGLLICDEGAYAKASAWFAPLSQEAGEVFGKRHPYYFTAIVAQASNALIAGDVATADRLHREALEGRRVVLGEKAPDYGLSLNCVAQVCKAQGDYDGAVKYFEQAVEVLRGPNDAGLYPIALNNLAICLLETGQYARAEPLMRECLKLVAESYGEQHFQYAKLLGNLAELMKDTGDLAQAEQLSSRCVAIGKTAYGERHPDYAVILANLAEIHGLAGDHRRARTEYKEALEILEETVGRKHPSTLIVANNLATTYQELEWFRLAERAQRDVLERCLEVHGPRHRLSLTALSNLASVSSELGKRDEARKLFQRCLELRKEALGENHPEYHLILHNTACEFGEVGRDDEAARLFRESIRRTRDLVEQTAVVQSERQQLAMAQTLRYRLDAYVSLAARNESFARDVFEEVLAWKGATLVRQRGMRLVADDPTVAELFQQLQEAARRLVDAGRTPPEAEKDLPPWRERIAKLTAEKERLESELSRRSAEFRRAVRRTTLDELVASLPEGAVLVDILDYLRTIPAADRQAAPDVERQFIAFIVRSGVAKAEQVRVVPLGPTPPILQSVDAWRESFGMSAEGMRAGGELRRAIWEPLLPALDKATTILVSTDGALGRLPLGALPGKEPGTYLVEEVRLATIPVPQLLPALIHDEGKRELARELLLLGDVDYEAAPDGAAGSAPKKKRPGRPTSGDRGPAAEAVFAPLANTAGEIATIGSLYGRLFEIAPDDPRSLAQAEATEANFRKLSGQYRHLHLATHGFFAAAEHTSALAGTTVERSAAARSGPIARSPRRCFQSRAAFRLGAGRSQS
ncbi:MAG: tetratricopeptide repeat protein [Pirellulales bacterium]